MKSLILASLLIGSSAFADTTLFNCVVPSKTNSVKLTVTLAADQSADFVTVSLVEPTGTSQFFTQADKGAITSQITQGALQFLAMTDKTSQTAEGVITNAGIFSINKGQDGNFTGLLLANSNIYQLNCTK